MFSTDSPIAVNLRDGDNFCWDNTAACGQEVLLVSDVKDRILNLKRFLLESRYLMNPCLKQQSRSR